MLLLALLACRNKDLPVDTGPGLVDLDGDGWPASDDCDDMDPTVNPDATETCNTVDDDCDGDIDEGVTTTWYADADGDQHGDPDSPMEACERPANSSADSTDCDDGSSEVFPGAGERCNDVDDDCDGDVDEDVQGTWYADADGDQYGDPTRPLEDCDPPDGYVALDSDCDDEDPSSHPGGTETCDGADNDCDGDTDEGTLETFYADSDGDGFGTEDTVEACELPDGHAEQDGDCDDADADVNPDAEEVCNAIDDDCDGDTDEEVLLTFYRDADSDGYGDPSSTTEDCAAPSGYVDNDEDCHDADASLNPDTVWTIDYDGDGYGDQAQAYTTSQCAQPAGYARDTTDCDDTDGDVHPGADEYCDGVDQDCNGTLDDDYALDALTWYEDADSDGYGDPSSTTAACAEPSGYVADDTDCEPQDGTAFPGSTAFEVPGDNVDQNCDGNDGCTDLTCDNLPDLVFAEHYSGSGYATTLWIYANDGSGGFSDTDRTALDAWGAYDVDAADIDGDGFQDILVTNYYDGSTRKTNSYVYWGSLTGHSNTDRTALPTVGALRGVIEDVDGDGWQDIVFGSWHDDSSYSGTGYVYYGSSTGFSTSDRDSLPSSATRDVEVADLDGDGYAEVVFCNQRNSSTFSVNSTVYWGSSTGYSSNDRTDLPTRGCRDVDSGDVDGDGNPDLVFANYRTDSDFSIDSYLYYGSGTGFSTGNREDLATYGTLSVVISDLDADGYQDLAFGGYYNGGWNNTAYTMVHWNSGAGFVSTNVTQLGVQGVWDLVAEDLDGDGYPELFANRYYSGSGYGADQYLYWGSSSGPSDSDRTDLAGYGNPRCAVGDLDGDGAPEIVLANYYGGSWSSLVDSTVYYGPTTAYGSTSTDLSTAGVWAAPLVVGD